MRVKKELLAKVQTLVARGAYLELENKSGRKLFTAALHEINNLLKVSNHKRDVDLLILKGNVLETLNQHWRAANIYNQVLKIQPANIRAHIDLGEYYKFRGSTRKALKYFDKALSLLKKLNYKGMSKEKAKDMEQVYRNIADILIAQREIRKAIAVINEGVARIKKSKLLKEMKRELLKQGEQ